MANCRESFFHGSEKMGTKWGHDCECSGFVSLVLSATKGKDPDTKELLDGIVELKEKGLTLGKGAHDSHLVGYSSKLRERTAKRHKPRFQAAGVQHFGGLLCWHGSNTAFQAGGSELDRDRACRYNSSLFKIRCRRAEKRHIQADLLILAIKAARI